MFICIFWFIGLIHKNAIMFYWSNTCVVAVLLIITLFASIAYLIRAPRVREMVQCGPNVSVEVLHRTKYPARDPLML